MRMNPADCALPRPIVVFAAALALFLVDLLAEFERQVHTDHDRNLVDQRRRNLGGRLEPGRRTGQQRAGRDEAAAMQRTRPARNAPRRGANER